MQKNEGKLAVDLESTPHKSAIIPSGTVVVKLNPAAQDGCNNTRYSADHAAPEHVDDGQSKRVAGQGGEIGPIVDAVGDQTESKSPQSGGHQRILRRDARQDEPKDTQRESKIADNGRGPDRRHYIALAACHRTQFSLIERSRDEAEP